MMNVPPNASEFFVAGGTLRPDAPSYVKRPADDELFKLVLTGEFCHVLTSRQMGKSSLMVRTARRLQEQGIRTAIIDLTSIGTSLSAEQWYLGLITELSNQLMLSVNPETWWAEQASLSTVQRLTNFLHDVVLAEIEGQVVIFIDEIDTTLNLGFSSDFFAVIRYIYNARASHPAYCRLTFVLFGVVAPADLIKDPSRTPFNIGHRIDLHEFGREDGRTLEQGLEAVFPAQGKAIFDRIFHWTNGHPYLTQTLCLAATEARNGRWTDKRVDELVVSLFLSREARKETNLQFVRDKILHQPQRRRLLALYRKVHKRKKVGEDERSLIQSQLKLVGLVKAEGGYLYVRNEIYRHVFDLTWVRENAPVNWIPIVLVAIGILLGVVGVIFWNALIPSICLPDQWCSQNDRNLKGKAVYALAGCDDGTLFAGAEDGIYRRAPRDPEWELEQATNGRVRGLDASPDCTLVYAAAQNHGVLRHTDDLWSVVSSPDMDQVRTVALAGNMILAGGKFGVRHSVAITDHIWGILPALIDMDLDSLTRSAGWVYAASWDSGVWYCNESNLEQWWPVNDGLEGVYVQQAIGSLSGGAPKFVGAFDGFYQWNGIRWRKGPKPWGDNRTFWFAADSATIYAGQESNGVLRSTNSGLTWEQMNAGWETPPTQVYTLLIHLDEDNHRWLYAGTSEGIWRYLLPELTTFCNGDFERRDFECWQHGGEIRQDVMCERNLCWAVLGDPRYKCEGGVPVGEAWIKQSFQVPQTVSPTLSLRYRVFSHDLDTLDFFQVSLNGELIGRYGNPVWDKSSCDPVVWDSGWRFAEFDLSSYKGKRIELSLQNVNGTYKWWNTWTYVDDVGIR